MTQVKLIHIEGLFEARPCSHHPMYMIEVRTPWIAGEHWVCRYTMEIKETYYDK